MGYYIKGPDHGKVGMLVNQEGATRLSGQEAALHAFDEGMGVVCVVDNGGFEAAGFAFSKDELEVFMAPDPHDRPKVWLAMDIERARELSGYDRDA